MLGLRSLREIIITAAMLDEEEEPEPPLPVGIESSILALCTAAAVQPLREKALTVQLESDISGDFVEALRLSALVEAWGSIKSSLEAATGECKAVLCCPQAGCGSESDGSKLASESGSEAVSESDGD